MTDTNFYFLPDENQVLFEDGKDDFYTYGVYTAGAGRVNAYRTLPGHASRAVVLPEPVSPIREHDIDPTLYRVGDTKKYIKDAASLEQAVKDAAQELSNLLALQEYIKANPRITVDEDALDEAENAYDRYADTHGLNVSSITGLREAVRAYLKATRVGD